MRRGISTVLRKQITMQRQLLCRGSQNLIKMMKCSDTHANIYKCFDSRQHMEHFYEAGAKLIMNLSII